MKQIGKWAGYFFIAGLLLPGLTGNVQAAAGRFGLPGQVPSMVTRLAPLGQEPVTHQLHLAIGLQLRNPAGLDQLLAELYDPASPNYHHYLTPAQFTEQFGPTTQAYQSLIQFAETNGLTVTATYPNRTLLDVRGSVGTVEKVFHTTLRTYRHPHENRNFYAPDTEPSIDLPVPLTFVNGLDNYFVPRPASLIKRVVSPGVAGIAPATGTGSGPSSLFQGNDFRAAYVPGTRLNGTGQSVALFELDGYYASDVTLYESGANLPAVTLTNVLIGGFNGSAGANNVEVTLDIDMVIAMATNLSRVIVYEGINPTGTAGLLTQIASDNLAKQISSSWLIGNNASYDTAYKQMAAQGQSFFQASGDDGAYYAGIGQSVDNTNIILVGGTTLTTAGPGGAWASETAWNWNITDPPNTNSTGGGVSLNGILIPSWQQGINMTTNQGSSTLRNSPDVALAADNIFIYADNGTGYMIGGTSAAAPLWAGFTALMNQQAVTAGEATVGFINPAVYALGKSANYAQDFHDITTGNNTNAASGNKYFAVPGYDLCTGWGTPNGNNLINFLAPPAYFVAVTNAGWSLLTESATPADGAIDPGETVTVNFTLQNAGTIPTGNLVATLQPGAGVLAPGGPQTYGVLAGYGGTAARSFTFTAAGSCGSNVVATLQLQNGATNLGTVSFNLQLGARPGTQTFGQNFDGAPAPALPSGWTTTNITGTANSWTTISTNYDTAPNSAFISDVKTTSENALVSPVIGILSANAQLSFRHSYSFDYHSNSSQVYRDGGVLEIKIGSGAFTDILAAGGSFVTGGYNNTINTAINPLNGRSAWVGILYTWQTVTVNLPPAAAGQNIQLRWNCGTDSANTGTGAVGWNVDSLSITDAPSGCLTVVSDLAASQSLATNSLSVGQNLVYFLTVTNFGPQPAANVIVTNTIPANTTFVSAVPAGSYAAGQVVWPVGMLAAATATNFTLTLAPAGGNPFTNVVSTGTVTPEFTTANNSATLVSTQSPATPPAITGAAAGPGSGFTLSLTSTPGISYILEAATNLASPVNWLPVTTNFADTNGVWDYTDVQATNFNSRFYRLKLQSP